MVSTISDTVPDRPLTFPASSRARPLISYRPSTNPEAKALNRPSPSTWASIPGMGTAPSNERVTTDPASTSPVTVTVETEITSEANGSITGGCGGVTSITVTRTSAVAWLPAISSTISVTTADRSGTNSRSRPGKTKSKPSLASTSQA